MISIIHKVIFRLWGGHASGVVLERVGRLWKRSNRDRAWDLMGKGHYGFQGYSHRAKKTLYKSPNNEVIERWSERNTFTALRVKYSYAYFTAFAASGTPRKARGPTTHRFPRVKQVLPHDFVLGELGVVPPRHNVQLVLVPHVLVIPAYAPAQVLVLPAKFGHRGKRSQELASRVLAPKAAECAPPL